MLAFSVLLRCLEDLLLLLLLSFSFSQPAFLELLQADRVKPEAHLAHLSMCAGEVSACHCVQVNCRQ